MLGAVSDLSTQNAVSDQKIPTHPNYLSLDQVAIVFLSIADVKQLDSPNFLLLEYPATKILSYSN